MKKLTWFAASALLVLSFGADAFAQRTVNPSGGMIVGDGLRIEVGPKSMMQIWRRGSGQVYSPSGTPTLTPTSMFNGVFLAQGTTLYGADGSAYSSNIDANWTPISQTPITGAGTSLSPYEVTTVVGAGVSGITLAYKISYVSPNDFFTCTLTVTTPATNTLPIKAYHIIDTFLDGGDEGPAFRQPAVGPPTIIGVSKAGQFEVFIQGDRPWNAWYSAQYAMPFAQIDDGADLLNTEDTDPTTDNGMGVQWNLGPLVGTTSWNYRIAFTTDTSFCGDGDITGFETCDDRNRRSGDGCSSTCQVEPNWMCVDEPSICTPECRTNADCNDGAECTIDACVSFGCVNTPRPTGTLCSGGVCDPTAMCVPCLDGGPGTDPGCAGDRPFCDTRGPINVCVSCFTNAECADANPCTNDACLGGRCTGSPLPSGAACPGGVCDGLASPMCVPCLDNAGAGLRDAGCAAATPICDESGVVPECVECLSSADCGGGICDLTTNTCAPCVDSAGPGGIDSGCMAARPACNVARDPNMCVECVSDLDCDGTNVCDVGTNICVPCLNTAPGGGIDSGCSPTAPICGGTGVVASCVECEVSSAAIDAGCDATLPICNVAGVAPDCVECTTDSHCDAGTVCGPANTCVPGCASDADCVPTPETPVCDTDARVCVECIDDSMCDGITTCDTATNTCEFGDHDDDGVPDDEDLDDDNDGIPDVVELGGTDLSTDADGDGIPDYIDPSVTGCAAGPDGTCASVPSDYDFDGDGVPNHHDLDADGDGITDTEEAGGADMNGDGLIDGFTDGNGDGLDDATAAAPLPTPDSNGNGSDDFLDLDSDSDGIPDATEGHDADHDGTADTTPTGTDGDGDGIDDAFDPDAAGTPAPTPDLDGDGMDDYQDADDDGDTIPTAAEVADGAIYGDDIDGDGLPNWYDEDSDGDTAPDVSEVAPDSDGDGIPENIDSDVDGVPDYLDPDAAPGDTDGDGLPDIVECPPPATLADPASCPDTDGDGMPDFNDTDDDGDGVDTADEIADGGTTDGDGDGLPPHLDIDSDGDGITDGVECGAGPCVDTNGDGEKDYLDTDSDADGVPDAIEGHDADHDGAADTTPSGTDTNNNGLDDAYDPAAGGTSAPAQDTDLDGAPDYQDADDDDDGTDTLSEDTNADGNWQNDDGDGDGIPDYLDPDGGIGGSGGGLGGGALCTVGAEGGPAHIVLIFAVALLGMRRRR